MKSFQQFLGESVNIQNVETLIINNADPAPQEVGEEFVADIVFQGSIHRLTMVTENGIPTKNDLTEYIQGDYPGAIVHNIYQVEQSKLNVKDDKRYHPAKLDWV